MSLASRRARERGRRDLAAVAADTDLLRIFVEQIGIRGTVLGTLPGRQEIYSGAV